MFWNTFKFVLGFCFGLLVFGVFISFLQAIIS